MKTVRFSILSILTALLLSGSTPRKAAEIISPDGKLKLAVFPGETMPGYPVAGISLTCNGKEVILPSAVFIESTITQKGDRYSIGKIETSSVRDQWTNNFGERKDIPDNYNEARVFLKGRHSSICLVCRAYDEGVAFSYEFPPKEGTDSVVIKDERIIFRFPSDFNTWSAARAQAKYTRVPLSGIESGCERPLVVEFDKELTIALAEAKLVDYARMKFEPNKGEGISIRSRLDGEVHKALPFRSPWRVIMAGKNPGDLLEKNYLLLNLNDPSAIADLSWIRPGKVLREVTLTTAGAKAAVDFTSSHGMQYVEFDAGWYGPENNDASDAREVNLDPARSKGPLDMKEVISYAGSRNIGILLYVNRRALEKQLDQLLPIYKKWGVKGIKFGFVQVGSQEVTSWMHEAIRKCASYNMIVDVHDEYRPTGFSRTYPSFLTQEGIRGDEESPSNSHTLITMFTRMLAGAGDNTICYYNERVDNKMGSHASQLAKAVCIFSPLQFLYWYDKAAPALEKNDGLWGATNFIGNEPELEFFNNVPTVWDETRVLHAVIGEYGVVARRSGQEWFMGGINDETGRELDIALSFLEPGKKYNARIYSDDPSVDTRTHVRTDSMIVDRTTVRRIALKPNNGFAMHIRPAK